MKKILISLMLIGMVCGVIGSGVYALFSDTEASAGNTFTSGTLNLQVGNADPCTQKITLSGLKPTDTGNAASWLTTNIGTINGTLDITLSAITNNENTRSEVETAAGDTTDVGGELGGLLKVAFWMDTNKDGTWSNGDYYLSSGATNVTWVSGSTLPIAAYDIVNNYGGKGWANVQTVNSTADSGNFRVEYNFPNGGSGDNQAQSDSCVLDIIFVLNQQ
jgi:predicted ribosomally synthesized peptide with SipW-like signal peptide